MLAKMNAHKYNDKGKCIYCSSSKELIGKFKWSCSSERIPQDRIVNEDVYNKIRQEASLKKLSESDDPWKKIVYQVYHAESGINGLSDKQFELFCLNCLMGEIHNGGLEQYFGNSSGDHVERTIGFLEVNGFTQLAKEIRSVAIYLFGDISKSGNRSIRSEILYGKSRMSDDEIWKGASVKYIEDRICDIDDRLVMLNAELLRQ